MPYDTALVPSARLFSVIVVTSQAVKRSQTSPPTAAAPTRVTRFKIFDKKLVQAQRIRYALSAFYPEIERDLPTCYCSRLKA